MWSTQVPDQTLLPRLANKHSTYYPHFLLLDSYVINTRSTLSTPLQQACTVLLCKPRIVWLWCINTTHTFTFNTGDILSLSDTVEGYEAQHAQQTKLGTDETKFGCNLILPICHTTSFPDTPVCPVGKRTVWGKMWSCKSQMACSELTNTEWQI